ncbi:hypothetical protein SteCoe_39303 [Stentor coeruleus]|uniref:Uncharacterized protein n=1 Tax=Stentor coeruleus TaxID=5963 RepID=A0A1R2AKR2_9CILI|nr:hypothetical protein SteCoe_39303 [Stentor coeruleus]
MYTRLNEDPPKLHIFIYLASALILVVSCAVDIALDEWFEYCFWYFNLFYANVENSTFSGDHSISHLHDDACDESDDRDFIQAVCPEFCDNLDKFQTAGIIMIVFTGLTFFALILVISMHFMLLFKKRLNYKFAWLFMILPLLTYMLGFIFYCIVADVSGIRGTKGSQGFGNPKDFEWKEGMILAVIIIVFMGFNLAHGMIFTRKFLLVDKKN